MQQRDLQQRPAARWRHTDWSLASSANLYIIILAIIDTEDRAKCAGLFISAHPCRQAGRQHTPKPRSSVPAVKSPGVAPPGLMRVAACRAAPLFLLLLAAVAAPAAALHVLPLHELTSWRLDNGRGYANVSLEDVSIPGAALQLLHRAGIVEDPLYRFNEMELRWAAWDNWTFSLEFEPAAELLSEAEVLLHLDGLDTVAEVSLNSGLVDRTANAHRPHEFDVTQLLTEGRNLLSVTLFSAPAYAADRRDAYPYPVPANQILQAFRGYNFVRKAASDFGWDWGPALAPAGINGAVELRGRSTAVLTGVAVRQEYYANGSIALVADALLLPPPLAAAAAQQGISGAAMQEGQAGQALQAERGVLLLELTSPDDQQHWQEQAEVSSLPASAGAGGFTQSTGAAADEPAEGTGPSSSSSGGQPVSGALHAAQPAKHSLRVMLDSPELWWPHDFGSQPLYTLRLTYRPSYGSSSSSSSGGSSVGGTSSNTGRSSSGSSSQTRRVGLRRVELVQEALAGGVGETFYFRVNGQPLYARGANVVPAHIFEPAVNVEQLRRLVGDAKAAHMNMLRVWGGGRYFADAFYDACDEAGVLVWQEAMFACAMYPRNTAFLQETWLEVAHQAARLSSHPSVVIWGGNNENEAAFDWFREVASNPLLYATDFSKIFVDVVQEAVRAVDPNATYVDTSPSNGLLSRDPYAKRWGSVADPRYGDVHFYDYASDAFNPSTYPPAKFVSEFGFMSLPSFAAYKQATAPEDWSLGAPMTEFRMRHANGLAELSEQMARHFLPSDVTAFPLQQAGAAVAGAAEAGAVEAGAAEAGTGEAGAAEAEAGLEEEQRRFASFTYLSQLQQGLAYQTAVHKWRRNKADAAAQTMGVLYWQLNDIWQGPSWSSINSDGSWRLLHHFAAEFFRPVLVSGFVDGGVSGDLLEVHLTNDLPAGVTGELLVDAIPLTATRPEHVVPIHRFASASVPAFGSRLTWTASLASDVLPAVGNASSSSGSAGAPADAADVFLRLRFCPSSVVQQQDEAGVALPNPFVSAGADSSGGSSSRSSGSSGSGSGDMLETPGSGSSTTERRRASSDKGGASSQDAAAAAEGPCGSPVPLPAGSSQAECAAARRLLQCSESLVFLTELKDARLVPAQVSSAVVSGGNSSALVPPPGGDSWRQAGASNALGGGPAFAVSLSSDAVALFVSAEVENQAGRFNASSLLLLPWQPQMLLFFPVPASEPAAAAATSGQASTSEQQQQQQQQQQLEPAAAVGTVPTEGTPRAEGAPAVTIAPSISVYWLQQELAVLQQPDADAAASTDATPGAGTQAGTQGVAAASAALAAALGGAPGQSASPEAAAPVNDASVGMAGPAEAGGTVAAEMGGAAAGGTYPAGAPAGTTVLETASGGAEEAAGAAGTAEPISASAALQHSSVGAVVVLVVLVALTVTGTGAGRAARARTRSRVEKPQASVPLVHEC